MADARRARAERCAARVAQTAPGGPAGARRSPSPVMNTATGPDAQEQQGSSQSVTQHRDGRDGHNATPSLIRGSWSALQPKMPHSQRALAMATEQLRYQTAPDRHHD
ncbi:hypothetical protein D1007_16544 [Hordeum vulgare]|nr:hypothetical protein D1007_16544 [Hordeum vulgare]